MNEFELTFLPKRLPAGVMQSLAKDMLDIYVPAASDHPHLRIRRSGEKHELTKKQPVREGDASHQLETTIPLSAAEFEDLLQVPGKRVSKIRYLYEEGGVTYEVDVFQDNLAGLVLVDVEFPTSEEKYNYHAPDWLLAEVTQEEFIAGGMLCGKSYADIEARLTDFGYTKIET